MTLDATAAAFAVVAGRPGDALDRALRAPLTLHCYARVVQAFEAWLAARGLAMPVAADTVCAWLRDLAGKGRAVATIRQYASAVIAAHEYRGAPIEWRALRETLKRIDLVNYRPPRQARPILVDELKALVAALVPTRPADARDGALLTIGWAAMLRRAELAGLDHHRLGDGTGYARVQDGGVVVVLAKSKTKRRQAQRLAIGPEDMPAAAAALEAWARLAKLKPGAPIFCAVQGRTIATTRMGPQHVALMLKRRVRALALASGHMPEEADELAAATSGHSLRAGCITAMALAGVPEHEIRRRSRHASAEMVARYVRIAAQWQDSGLKAVGF